MPRVISDASDVIVVADQSRAFAMLANEKFRLGPYQVVNVHRHSGRSREHESGMPGALRLRLLQRRGFDSFDMVAPAGQRAGTGGGAVVGFPSA